MKFVYFAICCISIISNVYSQDSLILHLNFDENLIDLSSFNHDVTAMSNLEYSQSQCGQSVRIKNSEQDAISVDGAVFKGLQDFTISVLVKIDGFNSNNNLLSCSNLTLANEFIVSYNSFDDSFLDGWFLTINGVNYNFDQNNNIDDLKWHHVVIIRAGVQGELYVDGQQIGNSIFVDDKALHVHEQGFIIGQDQDCVGGCFEAGQNWFGEIDELMVFSKALDENSLDDFICNFSSVHNVESAEKTTIYPNPFTSSFTVDDETNVYRDYELISISGVLISRGVIPINNEIKLEEHVPCGIYFLKLFGDDIQESTSVYKVIKVEH